MVLPVADSFCSCDIWNSGGNNINARAPRDEVPG